MSSASNNRQGVTFVRREAALLLLAAVALASFAGLSSLFDKAGDLGLMLQFTLLLSAILWGAFRVVHHAEDIAAILGEPAGTLVLTLAVIGIEVALVVAVMLGGAAVSGGAAALCCRGVLPRLTGASVALADDTSSRRRITAVLRAVAAWSPAADRAERQRRGCRKSEETKNFFARVSKSKQQIITIIHFLLLCIPITKLTITTR